MRVSPSTFDFHGNNLRTILIDGEPWFHVTDVCRCIGLRTHGGTYMHTQKLDYGQKQTLKRTSNPIAGLREFIGNTGQAAAINESGLYRLILRADSTKAKPFQDWVTKEVLPSIRKTGGYLLNEEARSTAHADTREAMPLPAEILQLFSKLTEAMAEQAKTQADGFLPFPE